MKKLLISLLAILYLGMSSGIAMELHYCMGKLAGIEWFSQNEERCQRCGMKEKKGGCCSDEYKLVKLEDAHKQAPSTDIKTPVHQPVAFTYHGQPWQIFTALSSFTEKYLPAADLPPPLRIHPLVFLCVFRL